MGETVGSVPGHFKKVAISLQYLLSHEDFTDLTFVCSDGPVHCHKAMLLTHSPFLQYLFSISVAHQTSDTTVISLPQFDRIIMMKLLQYVYKGKASFKKDEDLVKLYELAEVLVFDMSFAQKDPEDDGPHQTAVTSRTRKKKDDNKEKQTEENGAAKEVQNDVPTSSNKKLSCQVESLDKPASVSPFRKELPTEKKKDSNKKKQTEVKEDTEEVQENKSAPVNPVFEESPSEKNEDVNKEKQMEEIKADVVQDEDLSSALIKKFQVQTQSQNQPALVNPVQEKSPIIVAGKRKRVSQAVKETKGKKYQYYTASNANKVLRYQDCSDDDTVATDKEKGENDSHVETDVGSYEEGLAMDADVNECIKQRAALDKMKVGLKNCGREKNVKQKVIEILQGDKNIQNVEGQNRHADASVIIEVSNDPNFKVSNEPKLKEMCDSSVVGNSENSDGKDKVPQVNMDIKLARSNKQLLKDNVEGDKPLTKSVREADESILVDASSKPNDYDNINPKKVNLGNALKIDMSNVEGQSKQKASLDKMKVRIFNCAKEEHIKEKVEALMKGMEHVVSKYNCSVDSTEKQLGSKVSISGSKRKSKVESYSEETSDHSEAEDPFKKGSKKQNVSKAKTGDDSSKTDMEKRKRFKLKIKLKKMAKRKEMINESKIKTAKATDSKAAYTAISCYKCGNKCRTKTELRNHIVTHFYPELFVFLPASKPFTCPTCNALVRDKTSLARHFAFGHKEIYKYCTEDELNGETVEGKQKSVYCQSSSKSFSQSPERESWLSSANKNFNKAGDDSDGADLFAVEKDDVLNKSETKSKNKQLSNGGQEGSQPPENISEKFLGMDDNDPVDVDDLLQESDDGSY